jgi:DNA topoisomerase-1
MSGKYGPYITDGDTNANVPKGTDPKALTLAEAVELLRIRAEQGGGKKKKKKAKAPKAEKTEKPAKATKEAKAVKTGTKKAAKASTDGEKPAAAAKTRKPPAKKKALETT